MPQLILTNGDTAADLLAAAGIAGTILPWRDPLHEGPIVAAPDLERFSDIRAAFLAERFGIDFAEVRAEFGARDAVLRHHDRFDRIEIWLEHDLYDQLQLLQILDFFARESRTDGVILVQADDFLGAQTAGTVLRFGEKAVPVSKAMLQSAERCWGDLCSDTPWRALQRMYGPPTHFPFLGAALRRFLEELPSPRNGLGRTETEAMTAIAGYEVNAGNLFRMVLKAEEAAWMGDWSFFRLIEDMAFASEPLFTGLPGPFQPFATGAGRDGYTLSPLALTDFGQAVLDGRQDHVAVNGVERWWAGTRLSGYDGWRYDRAAASLVPPP